MASATTADIAAVRALITVLQQRCTRLEAQVQALQTQLASTKKG